MGGEANEFRVWRDGKIVDTIRVPTASEDAQIGSDRAKLLPGSDGALFVMAENDSSSSFVIEDDVVTRTQDLHALAQKDFARLLRTAPRVVVGRPPAGAVSPSMILVTRPSSIRDVFWAMPGMPHPQRAGVARP